MIRKCLYVLDGELLYGLSNRYKTLKVFPEGWHGVMNYEDYNITSFIERQLMSYEC